MKQIKTLILMLITAYVIILAAGGCREEKAESEPVKQESSDMDKWTLGIQAWTFRLYTFDEALEKTRELGLSYIEAFPGQKLGGDYPEAAFSHEMAPEQRAYVKQRLGETGITLVNYGVVGLPGDEPQSRRVFEFAREMGIRTLVSEPEPESMAMLDGLCGEYGIHLAIHNHPKPSRYWNPETVLSACEGRSGYIGACADTGHWVRSGLDPVECVKQLEGRIVTLHFKEIQDDHDIVWGTGANRASSILTELARQKFAGHFSIEYEYNWEHSMPEIARCVSYFNEMKQKLQ